MNAIRICSLLFTALLLPACSGDSVRVSTQSSNQAVSEDGAGSGVDISASSADGSTTVGAGSQSTGAGLEYRYLTAASGDHAFCLEQDPQVETETLVRISTQKTEMLVLDSPGCACTSLAQGEHLVEVIGSDQGKRTNISLVRLPWNEYFAGGDSLDSGEGFVTLIKVLP